MTTMALSSAVAGVWAPVDSNVSADVLIKAYDRDGETNKPYPPGGLCAHSTPQESANPGMVEFKSALYSKRTGWRPVTLRRHAKAQT